MVCSTTLAGYLACIALTDGDNTISMPIRTVAMSILGGMAKLGTPARALSMSTASGLMYIDGGSVNAGT